jgi:hypothetical protein
MIIDNIPQPIFEIDASELDRILFLIVDKFQIEGTDDAGDELRRQLRRFYNKGYEHSRNDEETLRNFNFNK